MQPLGFLPSRPIFVVKLFTGMYSGSKNPMVIVKIVYLNRVTLKLKVIQLSMERSVLCMTFTLKVAEWLHSIYS